jgi:hypothetical protein
MLGLGAVMLLVSLKPLFTRKQDWRTKAGLDSPPL